MGDSGFKRMRLTLEERVAQVLMEHEGYPGATVTEIRRPTSTNASYLAYAGHILAALGLDDLDAAVARMLYADAERGRERCRSHGEAWASLNHVRVRDLLEAALTATGGKDDE